MTQPEDHPDLALALTYASADRRKALRALFKLDEALGRAVRGARDPLLRQMRLTWWHEALSALRDGPSPADPALSALVSEGLVPRIASGSALAEMVEGWEALLGEPADLETFARLRGGTMFGIGAEILGASHAGVEAAGAGYALADLARNAGTSALAEQALDAARPHLDAAMRDRWPIRLRALGALASLAARDAGRGTARLEPPGHPSRMLRALRHRLTGR